MDCQQSSREPVAPAEWHAPVRSEENRQLTVPSLHRLGVQDDLLHYRSSLADRLELAHQRMGGIDFVVPVGADQHQVLHIRTGQQILEQIERSSVEPLQIVEEQGKRMFRPCEYADEPTQDQLKTTLRVLRRDFRDGRLFSYDQ